MKRFLFSCLAFGVLLLAGPSTLMGAPNINITDRLPTTKDPLDIVDVYSADDLPAAITAADGVSRRPLRLSTTYIVHKDFTWPRLLLPKGTDFTKFQTTIIKGSRTSVIISMDGDTTPHIWGRDIGAFRINDVSVKDISNAGAGRGTVLIDIVGGGSFSFFTMDFAGFLNFKNLGTLVDVGMQITSAGFDTNVEGGFVNRINPSPFGFKQSHAINLLRMIRIATDPAMKRPFIVFQGEPSTAVVSSNSVELQSGDHAFHIDSASTGIMDLLGNTYAGTTGGNFFRPDISKSLTAMANADISITSFADSTANPGVDTTVNFGSIQKFTRGQVILIADEAAYDGTRTIVRVADDQSSFDINVVFSTSGAGTLKITRVTSTAHGMVEGETHTISGTTSYNGTEKNLFVTDNTFDIPVAFVADDATGTVVSTGRDEKSIDVSSIANGAQKDSKFIAFGEMNANATATTITDGTYAAIDVTGPFAANAVTERWTLTGATNGIFTYNGSKPFSGNLGAVINALKSGATANYRFTVSINGAVPVFASAVFAPMEVRTTKVSTVLLAPVNIVSGDTVQVMAAGDGTGDNLTITDFTLEISE